MPQILLQYAWKAVAHKFHLYWRLFVFFEFLGERLFACWQNLNRGKARRISPTLQVLLPFLWWGTFNICSAIQKGKKKIFQSKYSCMHPLKAKRYFFFLQAQRSQDMTSQVSETSKLARNGKKAVEGKWDRLWWGALHSWNKGLIAVGFGFF